MKCRFALTAMLAIFATTAVTAFADDDGGKDRLPHWPPLGGPPKAEDIFKHMDSNHDGNVTLDEFKKAHERLQEMIRRHGPPHFRPAPPRPGAPRPGADGHHPPHRPPFHRDGDHGDHHGWHHDHGDHHGHHDGHHHDHGDHHGHRHGWHHDHGDHHGHHGPPHGDKKDDGKKDEKKETSAAVDYQV